MATGGATDRPLLAIAQAWTALHRELGDGEVALRLGSFSHGCSLISPLFGCLGIAFKFAEKDYVAKVHDLCGATKDYDTLPAMVDQDIRNDTVRNGEAIHAICCEYCEEWTWFGCCLSTSLSPKGIR